jgi:hypothetical protein
VIPLLTTHVCLARDDGEVKEWHLDQLRALESFLSLEIRVHKGQHMRRTVDFLTSPGSAMLVHHDAATLARESELIHGWSLYSLKEEEGPTASSY